jgi:hypothetical protein
VTKREKVAVLSDKEWLRHSVTGYLIPGEINAYSTEQEAGGRAWIAS